VSSVTDTAARAAALDPSRSFIVQAPAGSGKTELLIQRYLALLATVQQPEQVVAITFTRKAAAEMRARVQRALRAATGGETGARPHEQATLRLAQTVVQRDSLLDWALLAQPQRLRIDTLDAFNVWLSQQLPVLSDGVAAAAIVDKADAYYAQAARRTIAAVMGDDPAFLDNLRTLLRNVDNDTERLERLLAALLPRRDQWLPRLAGRATAELRAELEGALQRLVDDELAELAALCPEELLLELAPLLRHAAGTANDSLRHTLAPWLAIERPPSAGPIALAAWRGVATLLLTKDGDWRKRIAKPEGFGPEHAPLRDRCRALLDRLRDEEPLRAALRTVATLPEARYSEQQWQSLAALQAVLVRLAAELKVQFAEQHSVDFVELALAAQRALGQVDAPSELLLALDRRIQHLLVDEFQDTSRSQMRLLELLTAGWQNDDGRSLFLVGDPMQSIYRFRDADMSLFLRAKQRGIGAVTLTSLTLQKNFRSAPQIVEWVNAVFAGVFPTDDQLAAGTAGFRASVAARDAGTEQFVRLSPVAADQSFAEAERVVEILEAERARNVEQSIAVLVQSRTHLAGLRERLRRKGWPVHAVEIDTLAEQQVAQDLAGLTRALLHLGDRIAWLGVLHAPWCGLTWADLHALCHDAPAATIHELLHDATRIARLSGEGQQRARALRGVLTTAFTHRDGLSLARWIEMVWTELRGPACLDDDSEHLAAEQFFALLAAAERNGDLDDPARLHTALEAAQPQTDPPREKGIEIMTMHRAKGLEFDTVVLLGLGREPRQDEARALQWMGRVAADGRDDLLMVPAALAGDIAGERLTDFVRRAERARDRAERARLLYVATTRARERLHLVWQLAADRPTPSAGSMLAYLWPAVAGSTATPQPPRAEDAHGERGAILPVLRRLAAAPAERAISGQMSTPSPVAPSRPEFVWAGQAAVHVGTVVHRYLQRFADQGLDAWTPTRVQALADVFARELHLLGVDRGELSDATARVMRSLTHTLRDPRGRWVLTAHSEARSELRMTVRVGDALEHLRLDRTFVENGRRWIIDFKTSQHEGGDVGAFLDSEVARYAPQLERYARAVEAVDKRPVSLGLYFPLLEELRSWPAGTTEILSE
jgi:ATP-dependent exoDNAse (exonuclease V) beta subunit